MLTLISVLQYFYSKSQEYYEKSLIESGEISSRYFGGTIVKTPNILYDKTKPYLIGLTGSLASGKSTVRNELESRGLVTIDCDKLGHKSYEIGTSAYHKIIDQFGDDVLDENKQVNRKVLGQKVFQKPLELKKLNEIVWPEILNLLCAQVNNEFLSGSKKIYIVEAALLIDANWHHKMNEVWTCHLPLEQSIKRAMKRDGSTFERVKSQLSNQISNKERLRHSNVIINTNGDKEFVKRQINRAFTLLMERTQ